MTPAKRRSVYQGGKVVPEPTGHEHKKLSPRYPAFGGRAPNFRPPFERISDPQIPLTRQNVSRDYQPIWAIRLRIIAP